MRGEEGLMRGSFFVVPVQQDVAYLLWITYFGGMCWVPERKMKEMIILSTLVTYLKSHPLWVALCPRQTMHLHMLEFLDNFLSPKGFRNLDQAHMIYQTYLFSCLDGLPFTSISKFWCSLNFIPLREWTWRHDNCYASRHACQYFNVPCLGRCSMFFPQHNTCTITAWTEMLRYQEKRATRNYFYLFFLYCQPHCTVVLNEICTTLPMARHNYFLYLPLVLTAYLWDAVHCVVEYTLAHF